MTGEATGAVRYPVALRLGRLSSWLVSLPGDLTQRTLNVIAQNQDKLLIQKLEKLPTSVDNMNPSHPFIKTLASIPVARGITAHSIIPVLGSGPITSGDDGVVKYESAHIEEAVSELVVRSGHSVQSHPQAIEEEMKHAGPIVCQFKRKQVIQEHPHRVGAVERRIGQQGTPTVGERIPPWDFPAGVRLKNGMLKRQIID